RESARITVEQVVDDFRAVIPHQVHDVKLDSNLLRHGARVLDVLLPRTIAEYIVLVDPVFHVRANDIAALLFEQQRGYGAVDAAGHGDEDFFLRSRRGHTIPREASS